MKGLADAALLAAVAMGSVLGASALAQASWPRRSPAAAILLWQALGLAAGLAAVGTLVSLSLPGDSLGVARSILHLDSVFPADDVRFDTAVAAVAHPPAQPQPDSGLDRPGAIADPLHPAGDAQKCGSHGALRHLIPARG